MGISKHYSRIKKNIARCRRSKGLFCEPLEKLYRRQLKVSAGKYATAKQNKVSPLAWHDHTAAFRVRNLTNWLLLCWIVALPVAEETRAEPLATLIIEHLN